MQTTLPTVVRTQSNEDKLHSFQDGLVDVLVWSDDHPKEEVDLAAKSLAMLNIEHSPFQVVDGYVRNRALIKGTQVNIQQEDADHVCGLMNKALEV